MTPVLLVIVCLALVCLAAATWKAPRLSSAIVWALTATIFSSAALLVHAPGPFAQKALWITLAVPVIWVGFQFWTYWDGKPWRPAAGLIAITCLCGGIVFLSEPLT